MIHQILETLIFFALCGVTGMGRAVWKRAHDGSMTAWHELTADIEQDTGGNPFERKSA